MVAALSVFQVPQAQFFTWSVPGEKDNVIMTVARTASLCSISRAFSDGNSLKHEMVYYHQEMFGTLFQYLVWIEDYYPF